MKCFIALLSVLFVSLNLFAQPPDTMWTRTYGRVNTDDAYGICTSLDGGFFIVGQSRSFSSQNDIWLVRTNDNGDTLWTKVLGGAGGEYGRGVCETANGSAIVVGSTESFGAGYYDIYLVKVNSSGDTVWTRTYGTAGFDYGYGIVNTADGGYAVCGSKSVSGQSLNMWLLKFSASDVLEWSRDYGGTNVDEAFALRQTNDGGFLLGGRTVPPGQSWPDFAVVRTNAVGDTLWTGHYGNADWEEGTGILETIDGGCLITGWKQTTTGGLNDVYAVKTTSTGALDWSHTYGGEGYDRAYALQQATDGGYIIGGVTNSFGAGAHDFYFIKLNTDGDTLWTRTNGGGNSDDMFGLAITGDGGYVGVGPTRSYGAGGSDYWLVRLPGFSGVGGIVRDVATNEPLSGVRVGAINHSHYVISDLVGHYVLTLPPDSTYDIITYGPCVGRDTVWAIPVFQDSITAQDLLVGVPIGIVPQTSINIVTYNHIAGSETLHVFNDGLGILDFSVSTTPISPTSEWLSVEPVSGSIPPGDSAHVTVTVLADTTDDGVFDFYGTLVVHMNSCPDSAVEVNVIAAILDADEPGAQLPSSYSLAAYPNPFNPFTTLSVSLPQGRDVAVIVYDLLGREVRQLMRGYLAPGTHRLPLDAAALPSGLYLARVMDTAHNQTLATAKLVLLK